MRVSKIKQEAFDEYTEQLHQKLSKINLPPDINSVIARDILSQLDYFYTLVRFDLADIESAYQKTESIIRQNERTKAEGRNEDDRRRNASLFLENYPSKDNTTVNMYEWNRNLKSRYEIIKSIVQIIENKQQRLITMNGFLKIDKDIGSQYDGSNM